VNFLGIGPGEVLLILVLALIVFGPKRLPEIGRTLGKTIKEIRNVSEELTTQFRGELAEVTEDLQSLTEEAEGELRTVTEGLQEASSDVVGELKEASSELQAAAEQASGSATVSEAKPAPDVASQRQQADAHETDILAEHPEG